MEKCRLCNLNDADKTGSHIVPAFILKTLFERNKEFIYSISNKGVRVDIGRDVIDEEVVERTGKSFTDEELKQNQLPVVQDYILCTKCENALGFVESLYSTDVHEKIYSKKPDIPFQVFEGKAGLISLLWYSVLWRLSIAANMPFKLREKDEEFLREYIHLNLRDSVKGLAAHLQSIKNSCVISLSLLFNSNKFNNLKFWVEGVNDRDGASTLYCNEYILVFYPEGVQLDKNLSNTDGNAFKIRMVDDKNWKMLMDIAAENVAKKMVSNNIK